MRKILIIVGSIGVLYLFAAFILPRFVAVPFEAFNSKKVWTEYNKDVHPLDKVKIINSVFFWAIGQKLPGDNFEKLGPVLFQTTAFVALFVARKQKSQK